MLRSTGKQSVESVLYEEEKEGFKPGMRVTG